VVALSSHSLLDEVTLVCDVVSFLDVPLHSVSNDTHHEHGLEHGLDGTLADVLVKVAHHGGVCGGVSTRVECLGTKCPVK